MKDMTYAQLFDALYVETLGSHGWCYSYRAGKEALELDPNAALAVVDLKGTRWLAQSVGRNAAQEAVYELGSKLSGYAPHIFTFKLHDDKYGVVAQDSDTLNKMLKLVRMQLVGNVDFSYGVGKDVAAALANLNEVKRRDARNRAIYLG